MTAIKKAIELIGGPAKAAALLNVTTQAVCFWRDGKRVFPAEHCPVIDRATGGVVSCEELRPDLVDRWSYLRGTERKAV